MADRFSLPDETATFRQSYDNPTMTGAEEAWNPEEREHVDTPYSHARNEPSSADIASSLDGVSRTGGGEGGIDVAFENIESADPELLNLYETFVAEKHFRMYRDEKTHEMLSLVPIDMDESYVEREFGEWLEGHHEPEIKTNKPFAFSININEMRDEEKDYDNLVSLVKSGNWRNKDTSVVYKFSDDKDSENDELMFVTKNAKVGIKVAFFNQLLEKNDIRMRIKRPDGEKDNRVINVLHFLKLGSSAFAGEKLEIQYPSKEGNYNLVLDSDSLKRKVGEENANDVQDFLGNWMHGQKKIDSIRFEVSGNENKISAVSMYLKDGTKPIRIPAFVFRSIFRGIHPYEDGRGNATGFRFVTNSSDTEHIDPGTSQEKLEEIMSQIKINGTPLSKEVKISIGRNNENVSTFARKIDLVGAST